MGQACNFAKDDEEIEFEKHMMSSRKGGRSSMMPDGSVS